MHVCEVWVLAVRSKTQKTAKDDEIRRITYTVGLQLINIIQLIELIQLTEIVLKTFSLIVRVCKKMSIVNVQRKKPKADYVQV